MSKKGAYPPQQAYPTQPNMAPPNQFPTAQVAQAPPYTEAPPTYAELHQQPRSVQARPGYPGGYYVPVTGQMQVGPTGAAMPIQYYAVPQVFSPSSTVLVNDGYDPGARFGAGATANIPPPPPGCPPNAAQIAAVQSGNVIVTQKKANWISGGSSGGYTIW